MTLVERFIEVSAWPTSRKVALLAALVLPLHLFVATMLHFATTKIGIFDVVKLSWFQAAWCLAVVLLLLLSLPSARARKDARWTGYLFVVVYDSFIVTFTYLFGSTSSVFAAALPSVILVHAVYFDERIAWVSFLASTGLLILLGGMESLGVLSYAPLLLERAIDAQRSGLWFAQAYYVVFNYVLVGIVLIVLVTKARRLQELRLNEAHNLIRRYVPSQVADGILEGRVQVAHPHERRKLTIFFSDLVGFTEISEELEPEDLSKVLNEYFTEMTSIAKMYGGTVDELMGDAILIFFGAPVATDDKDHACRAARMAKEMQQAMQRLNEGWKKVGIAENLSVRMGINTGVVTIGDFGSSERMKYAALGKHVNLAARLQTHCEPGKVLLSHSTWLLVHDQIPCRPKGEVQLKGISRPVQTYVLEMPS